LFFFNIFKNYNHGFSKITCMQLLSIAFISKIEVGL